MTFEWPYYILRNGHLYRLVDIVDRIGTRPENRPSFPKAPHFATVAEAEAWLEAQDERGNVRQG